jgi:type VI protein secretion system component VasF
MRRSLVQGDDTARHPFLQSLPRHVRHGAGRDPVRRRARVEARAARAALAERLAARWRQFRRNSRITSSDVKDFLLAYCACFVAITAFIA